MAYRLHKVLCLERHRSTGRTCVSLMFDHESETNMPQLRKYTDTADQESSDYEHLNKEKHHMQTMKRVKRLSMYLT